VCEREIIKAVGKNVTAMLAVRVSTGVTDSLEVSNSCEWEIPLPVGIPPE
jgi:hypothetical protein